MIPENVRGRAGTEPRSSMASSELLDFHANSWQDCVALSEDSPQNSPSAQFFFYTPQTPFRFANGLGFTLPGTKGWVI